MYLSVIFLSLYFLQPFEQHYQLMIPPIEGGPLGQLCKITTRSAKFPGKNSRILISEDGKIVYCYFVGKLKIWLNPVDQFCLQIIPRCALDVLVNINWQCKAYYQKFSFQYFPYQFSFSSCFLFLHFEASPYSSCDIELWSG